MLGPGHGLVPPTLYPGCLTNPLVMSGEPRHVSRVSCNLSGDPDNCHIFYQCEINPAPMSCGDMMFNTEKQVTSAVKHGYM